MQIAMGSLEAIREQIHNGRSDKALGRTEAALQALHGAVTLSQHLVTSTRTTSSDAEPLARSLQVNDALAGIEGLLRSTLGDRIKLDLTLGEDLPCISCDRLQLESALLNLVINARDAMTQGGTLSIQTAELPMAGAGAARRKYVSISVKDTGCGMTSDVLARASEKFYTTKPAGRGSGLGLSMVRTFVERHHGQVEIDSAVGHGTRVALLLPCQPDAGPPP